MGAVAACGLVSRWPSRSEISPEVYREPLQTETHFSAFSFDLKGKRYTVTPKFAYEIRGIVVSCHDAKEAFDYYHEKWGDDLNVNDLCLVWGENVKNEVWRWMRFKSGSWTCYFEYGAEAGKARRVFREDGISNNHLLARDADLAGRLRRLHRGDQVCIKGYLVEYSHSNGAFHRGTSVSRTDTGNGACETIFVTDLEILKKPQG
jgi:hypothetical protein